MPMILHIILLVIFLSFACWYDGWWISPLTKEEGKVLYKALSGKRVEDQAKSSVNPKSVEVFTNTDNGKQFYMLNLIKDKTKNQKNEDIGAFESIDKNYAKVVFPLLFRHACHPVLVSKPLNTFSQPAIEEEWSAIFIIRYRSRRDLYKVVTNPAFQKAWKFKLSTIQSTTVIPSLPVLPGLNLKWILGLVLIFIGLIGT
ncbi:hypothetical protein BTO06_01235 [Tenacibaculum sp. SZ-18]|uniref:hypothetical protein n=1 Tax=Tenacibaculum sp. SZ-18 TaxID=754423 RepID=UPI000C2CEE40|nr:hypothetical protein [Tenacibaculum sp. SZ-18]AUC13857.1 hypothetical protein BTO06_01235 [Tenacibaculum sp. SZ-18]